MKVTEEDLDTVFAPELGGLDRERVRVRVREWYNGYRWRGAEKVYNPYDVLLLDSREFKAHWFETGTPAFLVETLFRRRVASVSLDETIGTDDLLSAFDVHHIGTEALLFQTGYLTILSEQDLAGELVYRLGYPNREVRQSLNRNLLSYLVRDAAQSTRNRMRLSHLLASSAFTGMKELFHAFFASIPYQARRTSSSVGSGGASTGRLLSGRPVSGCGRKAPSWHRKNARPPGSMSPVTSSMFLISSLLGSRRSASMIGRCSRGFPE